LLPLQDLLLAFVDCVERNGAKLAQPRTVLGDGSGHAPPRIMTGLLPAAGGSSSSMMGYSGRSNANMPITVQARFFDLTGTEQLRLVVLAASLARKVFCIVMRLVLMTEQIDVIGQSAYLHGMRRLSNKYNAPFTDHTTHMVWSFRDLSCVLYAPAHGHSTLQVLANHAGTAFHRLLFFTVRLRAGDRFCGGGHSRTTTNSKWQQQQQRQSACKGGQCQKQH